MSQFDTLKQDEILKRLYFFLNNIANKNESIYNIVSLKFRPIVSSWKDNNTGYQYSSEYDAGKSVCMLTELPEYENKSEFSYSHAVNCINNTNPKVLWVEHESGLEIIGTIAAILGIIRTIFEIWEKIGLKISNNLEDKNSDRYKYCREVDKIQHTIRYYNNHGVIRQEEIITKLIGEIYTEYDFKKLESVKKKINYLV